MASLTPTQQRANRNHLVRALRSGQFRQGAGRLRSSHGTGFKYCCLGVLAYLAGCNWRDNGGASYADGSYLHAPKRAMEWVGMKDNTGSFLHSDGRADSLANMNDSRLSFERIADLIESEPEGLFNGKRGPKNGRRKT